MTALSPGLQVTHNLLLIRQLGAGGMGTVWAARHLGLNAEVAVKFITADHAANSDLRERFAREATAAAEVRSPHVVQVLDHGLTDGGLPYIAMELLEGEDLAARVTRLGRLAPEQVAGIIVQAARALARAHDKGIIHRDIKPENIFLCESGDDEAFVKVLDFGIAKLTGREQMSGTRTGALLGTPYFMSPEQMVGAKTIDHRTDLWSLGLVAYYAMTGTRAFDAETIGGLAIKICNEDLPRASLRAPLSPAIDTWFETACARDPAARFRNAKAMADALVAAVGAGSVPVSASRHAVGAAPVDQVRPSADPVKLASTTGPASVGGDIDPNTISGVPKSGSALPIALGVIAAAVVIVGGALYALSNRAPHETQQPAAAATNSDKPAAPTATVTETVPVATASAPSVTTTKPTPSATTLPKPFVPASTGLPKTKPSASTVSTASGSALPPKTKPNDEPLE